MFDYLRTNHELCLTAVVQSSVAHNKKAQKFAQLAERFAFGACMDAMSGYDGGIKATLKIAKSYLTMCANMLDSHNLLENFKLEE